MDSSWTLIHLVLSMALEPSTEYSLEISMEWQHTYDVVQVGLGWLSDEACTTVFIVAVPFIPQAFFIFRNRS